MGKITPGIKTFLVFITFIGFTNFILSETKLDFSEINFYSIFSEKAVSAPLVESLVIATTSPEERSIQFSASTIKPAGVKTLLFTSVDPVINEHHNPGQIHLLFLERLLPGSDANILQGRKMKS